MLHSLPSVHTSYLALLLVSAFIPVSHVSANNQSKMPTIRCETARDDGKHMRKIEQTGLGSVTSTSFICLCGEWHPTQQTLEERLCGKIMVSAKELITNERVIVPDGPDKGKCFVNAHKTSYAYRAVTLCENSKSNSTPTTTPPYSYPTPAPAFTPSSVPTRCELEETIVEPVYDWVTVQEYPGGEKREAPVLSLSVQVTVKTPIGIPRSDAGRCDVRWKTTVFEAEEG